MEVKVWLRGFLVILRFVPVALIAALTFQDLGAFGATGRSLEGKKAAPVNSTVDVVMVDPSNVRRVIPSSFFGINYVAFWDKAQGSAASAHALGQTPISSIRFPGGDPGDYYDWQDPYYKKWSSSSPLSVWRYARSFGANHLVYQTNYQGHLPNPPGKSYTVNSPENAAAWVAYNQRNGINADMEVGNEEDLPTMQSKDDPAFKPYITAFNAQASGMHQVNRGVRILGPAGTNEWYWWALDGLGMFLHATGNRGGTGQVDGVSLHFYKGTSWYDSRAAAQYWMSPRGPWAYIQKTIGAYDTRRLPVYITEWNLGVAGNGENNPFMPTVGHALVTADMLGAFAMSGVARQYYFDIHGGESWGLLYGQGESRAVDTPTPTYYVMALWKHMGNQLVGVRQSDDAATVMSTYAATRRDGSLQVLAINKRPAARTVRLELQRRVPAGHRLRVYSLSGTTSGMGATSARYNQVAVPSPQRPLPPPRDLGVVHGRTISYRVPAYSAVVLDLAGTSAAPGVKWATPARTAPAPELKIDTSGHVGQTTVRPGDSQPLAAAVRSNDDVGKTILDLEVYDSAKRKVFQVAKTVNLLANKTINLAQNYKLAKAAYGGTYYFMVGVFGPGWSPMYAWNKRAGSFTVIGPPPPSVSASGTADPAHVNPGGTETFTANVSATNGGLPDAVVDLEVYSQSGTKVWQQSKDQVNIPGGGTVPVVERWAVPSNVASGRYTFKIGVFGPDWSPTYAWIDNASTFTVGSVATSAHAPPTVGGLHDLAGRLIAAPYRLVKRGLSVVRARDTAHEVVHGIKHLAHLVSSLAR